MFDGNAATVIGRRVGNYVVERTLAQGGMGAVFVARHPALGREAAVKFLGQDLEAPPELTKRFLDEARITANLRHPNIVDIFDFGELDGRLYYVMELLEGRDLSSLMRVRRKFAPEEVIDCLEQICSGLAAAHAVGVVHRDLKPGNIFVVRGDPPRLKLMDFGVAKIMTTQGEQTRYGQIIGTPRYMSPEQALGQIDRITPQSDIYSLGIIAYEMLAGVAPFEHDSPVMLLVMHVRDAVRPIEEIVAGVPPELAALVTACLAKEPKDRPASALAILEILATLRNKSDAGTAQDSSRCISSKEFVDALNAAAESGAPQQTKERFVEADTVLGLPEPPAPSPVVALALEVLSQREPKVVENSNSDTEKSRQPRNASSDPNQRPSGTLTIDRTLGPAEIELATLRENSPRPHPQSQQSRDAARAEGQRDSAAIPITDDPSPRGINATPLATGATPRAKLESDKIPGTLAKEADRAWANVQLHLEAEAPNGEGTHAPSTVNLTESDRTTLNRLLARMQRRGDFPAFVQNVGEVSKRADFEGSFSAQQLGTSILKDYALTAKLLRIVNSAYASRFGGKIYSIQHAIVILGFDRVRSLALSTSLFKNQGNKEHAERVSESAINSLVSGEIARQIHFDAELDDPEQATVCSMFRNLGRHLVLVYLPEMYDQISALIQQEGITLNQASERVLGISMHKLGVGIAERWRLPPKMISAMSVIPERTGRLRREEDKLAALAEFSNQLCEIVANDSSTEERSSALNALLNRHKNLIQLDPDGLTQLLQTTQQSFEQRYSSLLGAATKTCRFARTVATLSGQGTIDAVPNALLLLDTGAPAAAMQSTEATPNAQQLARDPPAPAPSPRGGPGGGSVAKDRGKPQIARLQLAKKLESDKPSGSDGMPSDLGVLGVVVAQSLAEFGRSGSSEPLTTALLQALQRHLDVPRILALRATLNRRELTIVGGVGDDIEGLAKELRLPLAVARAASDPFSLAYHSNRDSMIEDVFSPRVVSTLPQRYYEAVGSTCLGILSCNSKGAQPVVLLIDLEPPRRLPSNERVAQLGHVRQALAKVLPTVNY